MTAATKKILVVEDEKPLARALMLKLTHEGFEAESAGNGEDALEMIEKGKYDLVLSDLIMPKMDGFSLLESLKKKGKKVPVIILSNLSQEEDEKRATALGAKGFFIKSDTPLSTIVEHVRTFFQ